MPDLGVHQLHRNVPLVADQLQPLDQGRTAGCRHRPAIPDRHRRRLLGPRPPGRSTGHETGFRPSGSQNPRSCWGRCNGETRPGRCPRCGLAISAIRAAAVCRLFAKAAWAWNSNASRTPCRAASSAAWGQRHLHPPPVLLAKRPADVAGQHQRADPRRPAADQPAARRSTGSLRRRSPWLARMTSLVAGHRQRPCLDARASARRSGSGSALVEPGVDLSPSTARTAWQCPGGVVLDVPFSKGGIERTDLAQSGNHAQPLRHLRSTG